MGSETKIKYLEMTRSTSKVLNIPTTLKGILKYFKRRDLSIRCMTCYNKSIIYSIIQSWPENCALDLLNKQNNAGNQPQISVSSKNNFWIWEMVSSGKCFNNSRFKSRFKGFEYSRGMFANRGQHSKIY